jgi:hypothetical protein
MNKKKVLFISINDWANSGFKYTEAVNQYSEKYECEYFSVNEHPFGYYRTNVLIDKESGQINHEVLNRFREYATECDIIHCKENSGFLASFEDVKLDIGKPVVQTFGGSVYRKHHREVREKVGKAAQVFTVTTPDLIFDDEILVPFAIDTVKYYPIEKSSDCIIVGHSPTNTEIKGTDVILDVLGKICEKYPHVFLNMQQGLKFNFAIELKKLNHIFIDQFKVNAYGNSAVEAMAFGSAVLAGSDSGAPGFINFNEDDLYDQLELLVSDKDYLQQMMLVAREFCVDTHSYKAVSKKLDAVYDLAMKGGR